MSNPFTAMTLADMSATVTRENAGLAIEALRARKKRAEKADSPYKVAKASRAILAIQTDGEFDHLAVIAQAKADCGYGTKPKASSAKPKASKPKAETVAPAKEPAMSDVMAALKGSSPEQRAQVIAMLKLG